MKHARLSLRVAVGLFAALAGAGMAKATIPESVALTDVYGYTFPLTVSDPTTAISAFEQPRSVAINNNPGSPWKGTLYIPRRGGAPAGALPGIFYWKAESPADPTRGTLKPAGPDMANPDGRWDMPEDFELPAVAWWSIAVADDDYVYVMPLNAGRLYRLNPDLTEITLVGTGLSTGVNLRAIAAYGKGIDTEIWYNDGGSTNGNVNKFEPTAVDDQGRPIDFVQTLKVSVGAFGGQHSQGVPNSTRDTYYLAHFNGAAVPPFGPAKINLPSGVKDTGFPTYQVHQPHGIQVDPNDRVVYVLGHAGVFGEPDTYNNFGALHPLTGANLSVPANFRPAPVINLSSSTGNYNYANFMQLARYSGRHILYTAIGADANNPNVVGMVATDVPAPAPTNIRSRNLGTGTTMELLWTPADDPEVTGVYIYRSTTSGSMGTALNGTPITATSYTDTGLTADQTYYYTLISEGVDPFTGLVYGGDASAQVAATPRFLDIPAAPTAITVTDTAQGGELTVKWTTPAQYAEVINIYRSTSAGELGELVEEVLNPVANAEATWLDSGLANGTTYHYTVRAANVVGESTNTEQVSGVPTDNVPPTFAGITTTQELGYPGYRVGWASAIDKSGPITYNVYTGPGINEVDYSTPAVSVTGQNLAILGGLLPGEDVAIVVRAEDSAGNEDTNTVARLVLPTKIIIDPDQAGGANRHLFNPQPDPSVPALGPEAVGGSKGNSPDMVAPSFSEGAYFFQTNDSPGKSGYTMNIPVAGNYDISAWWTPKAELDAPNYTFRITYPNGNTENVVVDMKGGTAASDPPGNGAAWNILKDNVDLTPGTLTIIGDGTTITNNDPEKVNVSASIRAQLNLVPDVVTIYTATDPIVVDGNLTDAEWSGANALLLGRSDQDVVGGNWTGPADYSSSIRVKWNANGLYLAGRVWDDVLSFSQGQPLASYSFWDSLELYLGLDQTADPARTTYATFGDYQILITGYHEAGALKGIVVESANRLLFDNEFGTHEVAFAQTADGYTYEVFIPWSIVVDAGVPAPSQDQVIFFNVQGIDNDTVTELNQQSAFSLSTKGASWQNPQNWVKARFAGTPPARPRGDINLDGVFSANDVREALRVAGGLSTVSGEALTAGDVNNDGKITVEDALQMQRALSGGPAL